MSLRSLALTLTVVVAVGSACAGDDEPTRPKPPPTEAHRYGEPRIAGRVQIDDLTEMSGLTASVRHPSRLWTHNDSGGEPVLYCMTLKGAACGTVRLEGAKAIDWEDIASVDRGDSAVLYVADIGDNERARDSVSIYRLEEPAKATGVVRAERFDLSFPRRPVDAEAVIVDPETEDLYIVTKDYAGKPDVFVARGPLGSTRTLEPVGSVRLTGPIAVVTGASLAPSGDRIVLSTYASGYELTLPAGGSFEEIWAQEPVPVDLGSHAQGEAVAYVASGDIVSGSEGEASPLYSVEYLAAP